jgi:hypothetical protein
VKHGGREKEQERGGQEWALNHEYVSYLVTREEIEDSCEIFGVRCGAMRLGSDALFWYTWGRLRKAEFPRMDSPMGRFARGFARGGVSCTKE